MLVKDFWHSFFVTPLHLNSIKSKYFCIPLALDETPAKEIRKTEFFSDATPPEKMKLVSPELT